MVEHVSSHQHPQQHHQEVELFYPAAQHTPNTISVSLYVVTMAILLSITVSKFDEGTKTNFKSSMTEVAGCLVHYTVYCRRDH